VTDQLRVPRERLAYVIDATAAPVCILVPLSTWAVYVAGLLEATGVAREGEGMRAYLGVIPWAFYGWIAVALVPLVALGWIPAWGPMRAADRRVAGGGPTAPPGSPLDDDSGPPPEAGQLADFFVPVVVLVAATALSKADALHGVAWALLVTAVQQGLVRRRLSAGQIADVACRGVGGMVPALATILLAFVLKDVNDRLGLVPLVIDAVSPLVSAAALPAVAFLALSLVTFATGSFWGTYAIALPIVVPLARSLGADLPLTLGAVVSAGAFGSHACFFGDTTVLASQASGCENLAHAASQLPYVLLGAALATAAYFACGVAFAG
jgi:Na+/H+ antiporter NhaC